MIIDSSFVIHPGWKNHFLSWGQKVYLVCPMCPGTIGFNPNLLALYNVKYIFSNYAIKNPEKYNMHLYSNDGFNTKPRLNEKIIKYVCKRYPSKWCDYFLEEIPYSVYELHSVLPRTFTVYDWRVFDREEDLIENIGKKNVDEISKQALFLNSDLKQSLPPLKFKEGKGQFKL